MAWKSCSSCKAEIPFGATYWVCNVSTCNRKRTGLVFCSVACWDSHLPMMRHREAWAEERKAPASAQEAAQEEPASIAKEERPAARRVVVEAASSEPDLKLKPAPEDEILVVASKVKAYIRARSDMNTSAALMERISDHVRALCDRAIRSAIANERKTVLDRDLSKP